MIYDFGSYPEILKYLRKNLPVGSIMQIAKTRKLEQFAVKDDMVIFYGWSNGDIKCKKALLNKGVKVFPDGELSLWLGDKVTQMKYIDKITMFPLDRNYIVNESGDLITHKTPQVGNDSNVVVKIGNSHQGLNKYLKKENYIVRTRENVIFEEYLKDSRSIRILMIEDTTYIVEHKDDGWIKNTNPEEIVYSFDNRHDMEIANIDEIIQDARTIQKDLNMDYCGLDYVVGKDKTGLLEINDMIGLPDDTNVYKDAKKYWLKVCLSMIN